MKKQVFICDKCKKEEPFTYLYKDSLDSSYPSGWFPFLGKDFCDECLKKIMPKVEKIICEE